MDLYYFLIAVVAIYLVVYSAFFFFYSKKVQKIENAIISRFLLKVSKIPSLIEVMRNFVADESAFDSLTKLHSTAMIHRYETIYVLLEHNARIQAEFAFLMKLSMQIPDLQKHAQFVYIRDFIIKYEHDIKKFFDSYNTEVEYWNRFVFFKNCTIIGLLLPGRKKDFI